MIYERYTEYSFLHEHKIVCLRVYDDNSYNVIFNDEIVMSGSHNEVENTVQAKHFIESNIYEITKKNGWHGSKSSDNRETLCLYKDNKLLGHIVDWSDYCEYPYICTIILEDKIFSIGFKSLPLAKTWVEENANYNSTN